MNPEPARMSDLVEYLRLVKQAEDYRLSRPALWNVIDKLIKDEGAGVLSKLEWDLSADNSDVGDQV